MGQQQNRGMSEVERAIRATTDIIEPSSWLSDVGKSIWMETIKANPHANSEQNRHLLEGWVSAVQNLREARQMLDGDGLVIENDHGDLKPHPACAIMKAAQATLASLAPKLQLSADSRRKVGTPAKLFTKAEEKKEGPRLKLA